jgi:microcystin-dependent protein
MAQAIQPTEASFAMVQGAVNTLPWRYMAAAEHVVHTLNAGGDQMRLLVFGVDYTIAPDGDTPAGTGTITMLSAPATGEVNFRVRANTNAVNLVVPEPGTEAIAAALDRFALVAQQVTAALMRQDVESDKQAAQVAAQAAQTFAAAAAASATAAAAFDPSAFFRNDGAVSTAEFGYLDGVTGPLQGQFNDLVAALRAEREMLIGLAFPCPMATPPPGMMFYVGADLSRTAYPELYAKLGTVHGVGDGANTFGTPDLRGVAWRGLDAGRGLDPGRVLGSYQADAFQGHWHDVRVGFDGTLSAGDRVNKGEVSNNQRNDETGVRDASTDGVNGTPRTADETRMKNFAGNWAYIYGLTA